METKQNCNILTPTLMAFSVSFPFSWAAQSGAWGPASLGAGFLYRILFLTRLIPNWSIRGLGPTLLGAGFLYRILSPTSLVSKLTDFLSSLSYIIVQRPLLLVGVTIALIQPIYGQCYYSDIPQPDAPVIYIGAFPILTARLGRRSIYNIGCGCMEETRGSKVFCVGVEPAEVGVPPMDTGRKLGVTQF